MNTNLPCPICHEGEMVQSGPPKPAGYRIFEGMTVYTERTPFQCTGCGYRAAQRRMHPAELPPDGEGFSRAGGGDA